jgi:hypothetical protein
VFKARLLWSTHAYVFERACIMTGPCGPCSELYYDFAPERGVGPEVDLEDDSRFIEFYNLVRVCMRLYVHVCVRAFRHLATKELIKTTD